jgi:hypothetical protein
MKEMMMRRIYPQALVPALALTIALAGPAVAQQAPASSLSDLTRRLGLR